MTIAEATPASAFMLHNARSGWPEPWPRFQVELIIFEAINDENIRVHQIL